MNFADAFAWVVGEEGGISMDRNDPGNWTGGKVLLGELKGTKYGISAASFPSLNIQQLSLAQAQGIYKSNYWDLIAGDDLPYGTALSIFDFAVNAGVDEAVRVAQRAVSVEADGIQGPATNEALIDTPVAVFAPAFRDERIAAYKQMSGFNRYGTEWVARANQTCEKALS